jgi:tRNA nucleotidyltransferase (CCA-adding enzyme)
VGRAHLSDLLRLLLADARGRQPVRRDEIEALLTLRRRAPAELRGGAPLEIGELAIGGAELRELGIPPGPRYGELLGRLLEWVTEDPSRNRRDELMEAARGMIDG